MRLAESPGEEVLARLYHELAGLGARTEGRAAPWPYGQPGPEALLSLAAQASRYDPRLLWVVVELLARDHGRFNPLVLRRELVDARWPAALGVAFEFARRAAPSQELSDVADFVMRRIPKGRQELFFFGTRAFGGQQARRDAEESLLEYRRWGFLGREEPFSKELGGAPGGTLGTNERRNVLRRLAERQKSLTLGDYVAALKGRISYRQASRDVAAAPFLERKGTTRGARYEYRPPAPKLALPPASKPTKRPRRRRPSEAK